MTYDTYIDDAALDVARAAVVREHMASENRLDFDATIATFSHPRYELIATGEVFDGEAEVRRYFTETRTAFPDQRNRLLALHPSDDSVIVEFILEGTHLGPLRGLPPTGRAFATQLTAIFLFAPGSDRIETALAHPLTIGRALLGRLRRP
jgi:steroid delta-isomerase-like uncharacterized protein